MILRRIQRPEVNGSFEARAKAARCAVRAAIGSQQAPDFKDDLWGAFKADFAKAQRGRCGYCEGQVLGLHYGDVEHFRPKAEISELDDSIPGSCGHEEPWTYHVTGRVLKPERKKPGYWWSAYDWNNYLLSCEICNRQWKGNLFPVAGRRATGPGKVRIEVPLLLSPYDNFDPAAHFAFGRCGEIWGITEQGRATIRTCGLDRASLRLSRLPIARSVHEHIDEFLTSIPDGEAIRLLRHIHEAGSEERAHCGMVQSIFRHRTKVPWEKLNSWIASAGARNSSRGRLAGNARPAAPLRPCLPAPTT